MDHQVKLSKLNGWNLRLHQINSGFYEKTFKMDSGIAISYFVNFDSCIH
jgi:hypothetical protein